jgi:hypothetical protein
LALLNGLLWKMIKSPGQEKSDLGLTITTLLAIINTYPRCGAVAQLGERLNGIQEVDGSIPFSSTIKSKSKPLEN